MKEYEILKDVVPTVVIDKVLRLIHLDLFDKGISKREIEWWTQQANWFPHLRWSQEVLDVINFLPKNLTVGQLCEPQILVAFPETYVGGLDYHIDKEPEWANGKKYKRIVGVPLTSYKKENGGVVLQAAEGTISPELNAGDVLVMHPQLKHSRGINRSGNIRYSLYFRWLEETT